MQKLTRRRTIYITVLVAVIVIVPVLLRYTSSQEKTALPPGLPPFKNFPEVVDLAPDAEIEQRFASLSYGVHVFLWWNESYRTWDLENVRLMNFAYVKESFSWSNIQPQRDSWDWSIADEVVAEVLYRGRRLVARIDDAPDWAVQPQGNNAPPYDIDALRVYCATLAQRYAGQIEAYQVWNEPNLAREWGEQPPNPAGYVELLVACAGAIREADPAAIIISAGLSPTRTPHLTPIPH